jgi:hypothetical protein
MSTSFPGADKLTAALGLKLQNGYENAVISDKQLHLKRNLTQEQA